MAYLIEALEPAQGAGWYIVGSDRVNGWAQHIMRGYMAARPRTAFRVVEEGTRRIQVLVDPLDDDERSCLAAKASA